MDGGKTVIVAGIGCRSGCPAEAIAALVREAEARAGRAASLLAAPAFRGHEPGVTQVAAQLGLRLALIGRDALAAAQARCVTRSARADQATGLASVAEAAALAAAGPSAMLLLPRIANGSATCALAQA